LALERYGHYILGSYREVYPRGVVPVSGGIDNSALFKIDKARRLMVSKRGFAVMDARGTVHMRGDFPEPAAARNFGFDYASDIDLYNEPLTN